MGQSVEEIVIGSNGTIRVAPTSAAIPTSPTASPSSDWIDLGFATDKGATITDSKTLTKIKAWQLFYAARQIISDRDMTVAFELLQWDRATVALAFGGGTFTTTSGVTDYEPPAPQFVDERMIMVDWSDGSKNYRWIIKRGIVSSNVATNVVRTAAAVLPITFSILGVDAAAPYKFLTDDPAFVS